MVLTREVIRVDSVTGRMEGEFGYIRVATFNENTGRELNDGHGRPQGPRTRTSRAMCWTCATTAGAC